MTTRKKTAGNNEVLARVKKTFNVAVFREASRLWNEQGPEQSRLYVGCMFNDVCRAERVEAIFGRQGAPAAAAPADVS